jgi:hypothetical protein
MKFNFKLTFFFVIKSTGTLDTPMKKYDLMNQVNARGTYLW